MTQVPNRILEAIFNKELSASEAKLLLYVCRKTIGWNKETDWITLGLIKKELGIDPGNASTTLSSLSKGGWIEIEGKEGSRKFHLTEQSFGLGVVLDTTGGVVSDTNNKRHKLTKDTTYEKSSISQPPSSLGKSTALSVAALPRRVAPHVPIVEHYAEVKQLSSAQKKVMFAEHSNHAIKLLKVAEGNVENALLAIDACNEWAAQNKLSWSLAAVYKHYHEFDLDILKLPPPPVYVDVKALEQQLKKLSKT